MCLQPGFSFINTDVLIRYTSPRFFFFFFFFLMIIFFVVVGCVMSSLWCGGQLVVIEVTCLAVCEGWCRLLDLGNVLCLPFNLTVVYFV